MFLGNEWHGKGHGHFERRFSMGVLDGVLF